MTDSTRSRNSSPDTFDLSDPCPPVIAPSLVV
jgi:hypothetical protein